MKTGRESDQFPLRLPDGMRNKIRCEADSNNRSMNAEIVFQLSRAYAQSETKKADAMA